MHLVFIAQVHLFLQHDSVLIPAARYLFPSDQGYKMRYNPLHKPTINQSHKLVVKEVS